MIVGTPISLKAGTDALMAPMQARLANIPTTAQNIIRTLPMEWRGGWVRWPRK
jgi:hypothetical protein